MQNVNAMKQVTGLTFLLQESQGLNTLFNSLTLLIGVNQNICLLPQKFPLKKQFFLELYNCTLHPVLNMQHSPWRSCYGQEVQLLDNWLYKTIQNLKQP